MKEKQVVILGGGLAGLTAAIHLASKGLPVKLFEKKGFPHHKVCGEYLSKEVIPYLESLKVSIDSLNPVLIDKLTYSTPSGKSFNATLPMGGIGVSRYALDSYLYKKAKEAGVQIQQETVTNVEFNRNEFTISTSSGTATAAIVLGAFGKRSLLDKKLNRSFIENKTGWLAVKSHYKCDNYPSNTVSLHNFKGGYCGLSKTESGAVNVCYLATYKSFKHFKDPQEYQMEVLSRNKYLRTFFNEASPIFEKELTIAQVSFNKKSQVEGNILMLGDAAGLIHPLCGNGMAMAIHSAKIASESIIKYYSDKSYNRKDLGQEYKTKWENTFRPRMQTGRILQKILLNPALAEISQSAVGAFPFLLPQIIKRTHGNPVL